MGGQDVGSIDGELVTGVDAGASGGRGDDNIGRGRGGRGRVGGRGGLLLEEGEAMGAGRLEGEVQQAEGGRRMILT